MNDGELKTRITCQTTFRSTPHGQEDIINLEGIKQIIDEAKKEWLLIDDFRYNELGKGYIPPEQARQDWFKKWFGSE